MPTPRQAPPIPVTTIRSGNPGNFQGRRPLSAIHTVKQCASRVIRGAWQEARNGAVADFSNLLNHYLHRNSAPRFLCDCCGNVSYAFLHLSNRLRISWNSACPYCDSRSRHRGLALFLPRLLKTYSGAFRLLHFAPEEVLKTVVCRLPGVEYRSTDYLNPDVDFPGEDIQALSLDSQSFDAILCNHVLEHVAEDERGMAELARILKPSGVAVITIPGDWDRATTIVFPDTLLNGHYRDYGIDVTGRFQRYFARVDVADLHTLDPSSDGLSRAIRPRDVAFICRQPRSGSRLSVPASRETRQHP